MQETTKIRSKAMDLLGRREHTTQELRIKLLKKDYDPSLIEDVLHALQQERLLSDTRFVEEYINYRRNKGFGPLRIQAELNARGVKQDLIEEHLNMSDNAWFAVAREAWRKRFKHGIPEDMKERAKQMRFLQTRGFMAQQIHLIFHSDFEHDA